MGAVIPWSWSKVDAYDTCPRRFHETKILKNYIEPESDEIRWGNLVHKAAENRILTGEELPDTMKAFRPILQQIANAPGEKFPELKLAVNTDLEYVGFDSEDAWSRGVTDIAIINGSKGFAGDYKTGKIKPKSRQLDLMAVLMFAAFPQLEVVSTAFLWLQFKKTTPKMIQRTDSEQIWDTFRQDIAQMEWSERNNAWPAKKSGLCKAWCPVETCPHNGNYRR